MGLIIVTVALMKEPLLKVACAISEESSIRFNLTALLFKTKGCFRFSCADHPVEKSHLVHQNITISLEHVSSLRLT